MIIVQDMCEGARTRGKPMDMVVNKSQFVAGGNEGVKMNERSYQAGQNRE